VEDGELRILKEGKVAKLVPEVEHVTFSGRRARAQGQRVTIVTERCVLKLEQQGLVVAEIAPGVDLERDVLSKAGIPLSVAKDLKTMDPGLFRPEPMGLRLAKRAA
jgi:acyl CoA:acetate/3-ketoacid CoA transferase